MEMIVVSQNELRNMLRDEIKGALSQRQSDSPGQQNADLITRAEVSKMFGITLTTVHSWMKSGILPFHRIGGRTFFKRNEVVQSLKQVRIRRK
jgi:excisionase family DNA binding protein